VTEDIFLVALRKRIKKNRNALGLTQEKAAELAEMTLRHYQTFEIDYPLGSKDREFNPTLKSLRGIAKAFNIPITKLLAAPSDEEL
jgi:transcriptional regulator with XRE-family HTH domain